MDERRGTLRTFAPLPTLFLYPFRSTLCLIRVLCGVGTTLPLKTKRPRLSRINRRDFRPNMMTIRIMRSTKHIRVTRQSLKRRLNSLFRHTNTTKRHGGNITRLCRPNLTLNRILHSSRPNRTIVLRLKISRRLKLSTNRFAPHHRSTINRAPRRTTTKTTMSRHIPTLTSPTTRFLRHLFRNQITTLINPRVSHGVRLRFSYRFTRIVS